MYTLWAKDRRLFYEVNVERTRRILRGAAEAGVGRVVYTSTVGVLGIPRDGSPGTEDTPVSLADMAGDYKRSKFLAEEVARGYADQGLPVVIVNPSAPVGAGDIKPTPTGRLVVDFLRGKMWAYLDTGLNLVDVEVAAGHLLAAERGRVGERYILGGRNLALREIFEILGRIAGMRPPRLKLSAAAILPIAHLSEWIADHLTGRPPRVAVDAVRMARKPMFFDPGKAVRELGMPQTPVEHAVTNDMGDSEKTAIEEGLQKRTKTEGKSNTFSSKDSAREVKKRDSNQTETQYELTSENELLKPFPTGVALVEATIQPLQYELNERFWGWRPNDIFSFVTDNVNNFQLGVIEVTRRTVEKLAENISRTGTTSSFDKNLENAISTCFVIEAESFIFPSSEGKYHDGIEQLEKYAEKLKKGEANFYTRADNLIPLLIEYEHLLGSCDDNLVKTREEDGSKVSFFKADNYFYYA